MYMLYDKELVFGFVVIIVVIFFYLLIKGV